MAATIFMMIKVIPLVEMPEDKVFTHINGMKEITHTYLLCLILPTFRSSSCFLYQKGS